MFGRQDDQQQTNQTDTAPADNNAPAPAPAADANAWQHPGVPVDSDATAAQPAPTTIEPQSATDTPVSADTNELIDIKQQALNQLSPLVGHLDQTPEEKFRTTMMMIQASDDQSLVRSAYESAQKISDEKERAQALLDIINEINYFTQHKDS